jgi:hypothetical protein
MEGSAQYVRSVENLNSANPSSSCGAFLLHQPFEPVFAEQLNWMLRPDGSISTAEVIGWTEFVTPPADALGMLGMDREVRHRLLILWVGAERARFRNP